MDISAVLPVSMGGEQSSTSSLNEEFSATTPNGDKVFTKPLGDKTTFRTPCGGEVTVAFIFDPDEAFNYKDSIASISTDYMTDLREGFSKHVLDPKVIAPKTKTLQETIWDQLTSSLPKETLAKNVFSDKEQLTEYMDIIKQVTTANYNEESALTDFLKEKDFSFSFRIAVDAYPDDNNGSKSSKKKEKTGVLTFHLEGQTKPLVEEKTKEEVKKVATKEDATKESKEKDSASSNENSKKRKLNGGEEEKDVVKKEESSSKKAKKEKEIPARKKLLQELNLEDVFTHAEVVRVKELPLTAHLFFEAIGKWFSSCISSKHSKLEKAKNKNPLYQ